VLRPVLAIARACDRLERALYEAVLAVGRISLALGRATRTSDELGIDGLIFALVRSTVTMGGRARRLQSGLIHRELAFTLTGTVLITAALLTTALFY